ncbi:MAG: 23S rRNA (uracil(1939)-C(5))-methyltransferase RlmD, partial [Elusimicrobia bacterium]|nr:23S rRNA (uracil(1939)-C(5))-methyltransferase RlmD [Elusimicrobiota bacterium]
GLVLGFKKRKRWDFTLNMRECRIFSPRAGALLEAVRAWAGREGLPAYDSKTHNGFLRHLVLREGKNTGQMMVILVSGGGLSPEAVEGLQKSFVEAALKACPGATVLWGENAKLADTAVSDTLKTLSGPGYIEERMGDLVFRISPHSFFQTNSRGAQELYAVLRGWVEDSAARRVLDLYCGGGGISLTLARSVEKVVGVEIHPDAVADARRNALLNGIANAEFYAEKAEAFLNFGSISRLFPGQPAGGGQDWTAVVDPPRSGLHPGVLKALLAIRPRFIIYVSCNPKLLPADLKALSQCYKMDKIEAFDLFPHTDHFEAALQLSLL